MFWMPMFLYEVFHLTNQEIANVQTIYELGTISGAIILGFSSDFFYGRRSPIIAIALIISSLASFTITFIYTDLSSGWLRALMFVLGFCIGTTHHLICITSTADLGRQ
jgi:sugar phosphate permease